MHYWWRSSYQPASGTPRSDCSSDTDSTADTFHSLLEQEEDDYGVMPIAVLEHWQGANDFHRKSQRQRQRNIQATPPGSAGENVRKQKLLSPPLADPPPPPTIHKLPPQTIALNRETLN